jgi:hypothetical protein
MRRRLLPSKHARCGEADMMVAPKYKPARGNEEDEEKARRHQEKALDDALKNTFPASDPVSIEQPTTPATDRGN